MKSQWFGLAVLFIGSLKLTASFASPIVSYRADIAPDIAAKKIVGRAVIALDMSRIGREISFSTHELLIDGVRFDSKNVDYKVVSEILTVQLPKSQKAGARSELEISYHGQPKRGLVFGQDYVYSAFSTCHWMICDESLEKHPLEMRILIPKNYKMVASGDLVSKQTEQNGLIRYTWKQDRPYPSYLFGFAAGKFNETTAMYGAVNLRYLAVIDDAQNLDKKFQGTSRAIQFFESKSGVSFPNKTYTQVLVPNDEAQEMTSFSVIGNEVLDPILQNPQDDWSIVHELAHQWWGNLLTCKTWKDFWLNEGITVFMTAAYKQERWGEAAYQKELTLARGRYQKAIDAQLDVPLTYAGDYPSIQIKRAIVYSKGALFMDALRSEMGEATFWSGFKQYTQRFAGKSVESTDFQKEMEKAAGRSLMTIFKKWVF